jgi:hypothetical protein
MKVRIYVPRIINIDDRHLGRLARAAQKRKSKRTLPGVRVEELVEEARLEGTVDIPDEDYMVDGDDERRYMCRRLMTFNQWSNRIMKALRNHRRAAKRRGRKQQDKDK